MNSVSWTSHADTFWNFRDNPKNKPVEPVGAIPFRPACNAPHEIGSRLWKITVFCRMLTRLRKIMNWEQSTQLVLLFAKARKKKKKIFNVICLNEGLHYASEMTRNPEIPLFKGPKSDTINNIVLLSLGKLFSNGITNVCFRIDKVDWLIDT